MPQRGPLPAPVTDFPATTTLAPSMGSLGQLGDREPILSLDVAKVTEPCPDLTPGGAGVTPVDGASVGEATNEDAIYAEVGKLEPMLGQVWAYAAEHPNTFGSAGMVWHSAGDASVFATFTAEPGNPGIAAHREALAELMAFPEELIVCQVAISENVRRQLEATLISELKGRYLSIGGGSQGVRVVLKANEEALAAELQERYGNAVELEVGALGLPLERGDSPTCTPRPVGTDIPGLNVEVTAPIQPLPSADTEHQRSVTLTNTTDTPLSFSTGSPVGVILDPSGRAVSAQLVAMTANEILVELEPGSSTDIRLFVSTASCDPALGYALPPGDYLLVAGITHIDGEISKLATEPVPVSISP